jgi:hypothetical protein
MSSADSNHLSSAPPPIRLFAGARYVLHCEDLYNSRCTFVGGGLHLPSFKSQLFNRLARILIEQGRTVPATRPDISGFAMATPEFKLSDSFDYPPPLNQV